MHTDAAMVMCMVTVLVDVTRGCTKIVCIVSRMYTVYYVRQTARSISRARFFFWLYVFGNDLFSSTASY